MKTLILILLSILFVGCCSPQVISTPPNIYNPTRPTNDKELIKEWQGSLMQIKKWQAWYDIQVGSNYFNNTNKEEIK